MYLVSIDLRDDFAPFSDEISDFPSDHTDGEHSRDCLSINIAQYYADRVIIALNHFDIQSFHQSLASLCTNNVKISKHVYPHNGLRDTEFKDLTTFCSFLEAWHIFVPDGVFKASTHQTVSHRSQSIVCMSEMTFSGQNLVQEVDLLNTHFENYDKNVHEKLVSARLLQSGFLQSSGNQLFHSFVRIEGSLAIYVNEEGRIYQLELFLRHFGL